MKKPFHKLSFALLLLDLVSTFTADALIFSIISAILSATSLIVTLVRKVNPPEKIVMVKMEALQDKMSELNKSIIIPQQFVENLPEILRQALRIHDLHRYTATLNKLYGDYEEYAKNLSHYEKSTVENYARTVVSNDVMSGRDILYQIHALMIPSSSGLGDKGIIHSFIDSLMGLPKEEKCKLQTSPHEAVFNIYKYIEFQELKAYIMTHFGYTYLTMRQKGNHTAAAERLTKIYTKMYDEDMELTENVIHALPRKIEKC